MIPYQFVIKVQNMRRCIGFGILVGLLGLAVPLAQAQQQDLSSVVARVVEDVCDRKVVLLGELPSHGEAHTFQAKAQIVEGLVAQCGFDVLLFEAGIYDFLGFEAAIAEQQATFWQLNRAVGRFWWTQGLADWRRGLFEQASAGTMFLGGLDDQPSVTSDYARSVLSDLVADALPPSQAASCSAAVDRNLFWRYDDEHAFDEAAQILLERCAQQAANAAGENDASADTVRTPPQMMLANLASYYHRQRANAPDRDTVMYRNLRWYRARRSDTSKVIIWTATVHAARQEGARPDRPLGSYLAAEWGDKLAAIGFTTYAGASSMAGMPSQPFPEAPTGSLEARAVTNGGAFVYLDALSLRELGVVPSRLFGRFDSFDWSTYFDGVVVIREETPPVFEAWQSPGP